ncbi:MAG: hypothetical protein PHG00_04480, partial [Methylococcales bacterium]|nr:hypothetical protein [Methylococcales bacterium]
SGSTVIHHRLMPVSLVTLERQDRVGLLLQNLSGNDMLATHRVQGDDVSCQGQTLQPFWDGGNLVGFAIHRPLPKA